MGKKKKPRRKKILNIGLAAWVIWGAIYGAEQLRGSEELPIPVPNTITPPPSPTLHAASSTPVPEETSPTDGAQTTQREVAPPTATEKKEAISSRTVSLQELHDLAIWILQTSPSVTTQKCAITAKDNTFQIATNLTYDTKVPFVWKVDVAVAGTLKNDGARNIQFVDPQVDAGTGTFIIAPLAKPVLANLIPKLQQVLEAKYNIKIEAMHIEGDELVLTPQATS